MKHGVVRNKIVETAANLFYSNGYNLTGINEIIKVAGIAKATLYNHFKSKEDICIAYLQYRNSHFIEMLTTFVANSKEDNKALALFDFLQEFYCDSQFNGCWCLNTFSELPKENEAIKSIIVQQKDQFLGLIKGLLDEELGIKDRARLAKRIYLLYEAAISESHLHGKDWPIKEAKLLCAQIMK